jgi:hypothetical protein
LLVFLGGTFAGIGIVLLSVAGVLTLINRDFLADAERTEGVVVDLEVRTRPRTSSQSSRPQRRTWYPIVEFTAPDGNPVVFESNVGSNPPRHQVGDRVEVAYDPANPTDARLTGFTDTYLFPLIAGGLGLGFTAVGTPMFAFSMRSLRRRAWLREHGQEIWTPDVEMDQLRNVRINGRHPYVIRATWQDPATGRTHTATSDPRRNPFLEHAPGTLFRVLFKPDCPEQCLVDLDAQSPDDSG